MKTSSTMKDNIFCPDCMFKAILDSVQFGILTCDTNGYIIYLNDVAKNLLGISAIDNELNIAEVDHNSWKEFKKIMRTGKPQIGFPVKNRSKRLVATRSPIYLKGNIIGVLSVFHELNKYLRISKSLEKYSYLLKQLDAIIESTSDGIFVTDGQGKIIRVNSSYEQITSLCVSKLIGKNVRDMLDQGIIDKSITMKVMKSKKKESINQVLSNGKEILVTGNPVFNENGELIMVVNNAFDMTVLNKLHSKLKESNEKVLCLKEKLKEFSHTVYHKDNFVYVSEQMKHLFSTLYSISSTNAPVLITGETGTGKERIAEEVHHNSQRSRDGLLVKINCSAIPGELLESELFGYEKGAFTGAKGEGKPGLFEIADKGTIFLDEIDSMPLGLQSKLLRVLQHYEIRRLGGTVTKKIDTRVISASNRDIKEMVANKLFREDLFYRLNVIPIYIPPLRERPDDIEALVIHFINYFNRKHDKDKKFSPRCMEVFKKYHWPGNVRELENLIERLIITVRDSTVDLKHIPKEFFKCNKNYSIFDKSLTLKQQVVEFERNIILQAIMELGNARKAAAYLGVDPSTISRKLQNGSKRQINYILRET